MIGDFVQGEGTTADNGDADQQGKYYQATPAAALRRFLFVMAVLCYGECFLLIFGLVRVSHGVAPELDSTVCHQRQMAAICSVSPAFSAWICV